MTIPTLSCMHFRVVNKTIMQKKKKKGAKKVRVQSVPSLYKNKYEMNLIKVGSPCGPFCALRLSTPGWHSINRILNVAHEISMALAPGNTSPPELSVVGSLQVLVLLSYIWRGQHWQKHFGKRKEKPVTWTQASSPHGCNNFFFFAQQTTFWILPSIYNLGVSLNHNHYLWEFSCFGEK